MSIPSWTEAETAYIAGIIDGEGCIGIYYKKTNGYFIQLTIVNTNRELISWLESKLHSNSMEKLRDKRPNNKQAYAVTVDRMRAYEVLKRITSYVIAKRENVDLALKFKGWQNDRKTDKTGFGHHTYGEEEKQICQSFVSQSRILNQRGILL